jgi:hypothetical protein
MQCVRCDDAIAVTKVEISAGIKIPMCITCLSLYLEALQNEKENIKIKRKDYKTRPFGR